MRVEGKRDGFGKDGFAHGFEPKEEFILEGGCGFIHGWDDYKHKHD